MDWSFVLPVLEYCSTVWCWTADLHLNLLNRVVRSASFLAGGVLECNLAHRRFVAVLYMLYKTKSNPMHPFSGALPLLFVPARVTCGALVAHRHSFAVPRCRTSQYRRTFVPHSVSLWNDLSYPVFDGVGLAGFHTDGGPTSTCWPNLFFMSPTFFLYFFLPWVGCVGWGSSDL